MIIVELLLTDGKSTGVSSEGHAEFAAKGSDIVCAAVSVLIEQLKLTLTSVLGLQIRLEEGPGLARIELKDKPSASTELVFAGFIVTLRALQNSYPKRIDIRTGTTEPGRKE